MSAEIEGDFVIFLIGARYNKLWKLHKWLPVFAAMGRMLTELLSKGPASGLLHARTHFSFRSVLVVQYWRSFDALHAYAVDAEKAHLPAWKAFNRAVGSNGDVGIWHETYLVRAGEYESLYTNMPTYGLGRAGAIVPATGRRATAKRRLGRPDDSPDPDSR